MVYYIKTVCSMQQQTLSSKGAYSILENVSGACVVLCVVLYILANAGHPGTPCIRKMCIWCTVY